MLRTLTKPAKHQLARSLIGCSFNTIMDVTKMTDLVRGRLMRLIHSIEAGTTSPIDVQEEPQNILDMLLVTVSPVITACHRVQTIMMV